MLKIFIFKNIMSQKIFRQALQLLRDFPLPRELDLFALRGFQRVTAKTDFDNQERERR